MQQAIEQEQELWESVQYMWVTIALCAMVGLPQDPKQFYEVARPYLESVK